MLKVISTEVIKHFKSFLVEEPIHSYLTFDSGENCLKIMAISQEW